MYGIDSPVNIIETCENDCEQSILNVKISPITSTEKITCTETCHSGNSVFEPECKETTMLVDKTGEDHRIDDLMYHVEHDSCATCINVSMKDESHNTKDQQFGSKQTETLAHQRCISTAYSNLIPHISNWSIVFDEKSTVQFLCGRTSSRIDCVSCTS